MAFAQIRECLRKIPALVSLLAIAAGAAVSLYESRVFGLQELFIGSIIMVAGLFALCLHCPHPFSSIPGLRRIGALACFGGLPMGIAYVVHLAILQVMLRVWRVDPLTAGASVAAAVWLGCAMVSLVMGYACAFAMDATKGLFNQVRRRT